MAAPELTREDIIRYAKADLDEDGDTFWTTTALEDYADRANRAVYRDLLRVNPGFFLETTKYTWPGGDARVDISSVILGEEPQLILDIEETSTSADIGNSNLPRMLVPMRFTERPMQYTSDWRSGSLISQHAWELQGNTLFIARIPSQALHLHIHWVKQLAPFTSGTPGDIQAVLNGFAQPYHDAVAACMAYMMNVKQEGENPEVIKKWTQWREDIRTMAYKRRVDGPRHITITRRH
jgi:hypothetical protein